MPRQFHRPARLDPEVAESLEGDADVAATSELAHHTAQLLIGVAGADDAPGATDAPDDAPTDAPGADGAPGTPDAPAPHPGTAPTTPTTEPPLRVTREGVTTLASQGVDGPGGVDAVAELWATSPATTLPGTLWRLFLLREWLRRDPGAVARRYATTIDLSAEEDGSPALARLGTALATAHRAPSPQLVRERLDAVLSGAVDGLPALAPVCALASAFLTAVVAASDAAWIDDDADALADRVTRRDEALAATAAELAQASREAAAGRLL